MSFESNRLKEISSSQQSGVALRVIDDGRIGFTSTTNPDIEPALVDRAAALAEFGSRRSSNSRRHPTIRTFRSSMTESAT